MEKKYNFLSKENKQRVLKKMYQYHLENGGRIGLDVVTAQVDLLMNKWNKLDSLDYVESIIHYDWMSELEWINDQFINEHKHIFIKKYKDSFKKTHELDLYGYRSLDVQKKESNIVDNSQYRYGNKIPIYQKLGHMRFYDRSNDGLYQGRSIDNFQHSRYSDNMTELLNHVDKKYKDIDDHYKPYHGSSSDTLYDKDELLFTGWNI